MPPKKYKTEAEKQAAEKKRKAEKRAENAKPKYKKIATEEEKKKMRRDANAKCQAQKRAEKAKPQYKKYATEEEKKKARRDANAKCQARKRSLENESHDAWIKRLDADRDQKREKRENDEYREAESAKNWAIRKQKLENETEEEKNVRLNQRQINYGKNHQHYFFYKLYYKDTDSYQTKQKRKQFKKSLKAIKEAFEKTLLKLDLAGLKEGDGLSQCEVFVSNLIHQLKKEMTALENEFTILHKKVAAESLSNVDKLVLAGCGEDQIEWKQNRLTLCHQLLNQISYGLIDLLSDVAKEVSKLKQEFLEMVDSASPALQKRTNASVQSLISNFKTAIQTLELDNSRKALQIRLEKFQEIINHASDGAAKSFIFQESSKETEIHDEVRRIKDECDDAHLPKEWVIRLNELKSKYEEKEQKLHFFLNAAVEDVRESTGAWTIDDSNSWKKERDDDFEFCHDYLIGVQDYVVEDRIKMIEATKIELKEFEKSIMEYRASRPTCHCLLGDNLCPCKICEQIDNTCKRCEREKEINPPLDQAKEKGSNPVLEQAIDVDPHQSDDDQEFEDESYYEADAEHGDEKQETDSDSSSVLYEYPESMCEYEKIRLQNIAEMKQKFDELRFGQLLAENKKAANIKIPQPRTKHHDDFEKYVKPGTSTMRLQPERNAKNRQKLSNEDISESEDESHFEDVDELEHTDEEQETDSDSSSLYQYEYYPETDDYEAQGSNTDGINSIQIDYGYDSSPEKNEVTSFTCEEDMENYYG